MIGPQQEEQSCFTNDTLPSWSSGGQAAWISGGAACTEVIDRAPIAHWRSACTDETTQVHQPLGIRHDVVRTRQQRFGKGPKLGLHPWGTGPTFDSERARQHPLDVAIQDGGSFTKGKDGDCCCRGAADSRQSRDVLAAPGKVSIQVVNDVLCGSVKVTCTSVVAKTAPMAQNIVWRRIGQYPQDGKTCQESLEVRHHRTDLGLLEHDLRDPDGVRFPGSLPWKGMTAVNPLPTNDALGKGVVHRAIPDAAPTQLKTGALQGQEDS